VAEGFVTRLRRVVGLAADGFAGGVNTVDHAGLHFLPEVRKGSFAGDLPLLRRGTRSVRGIDPTDEDPVRADHDPLGAILHLHPVRFGQRADLGRDHPPPAPQADVFYRLGRDVHPEEPLHGLLRLGEHPADLLAGIGEQALGQLREVALTLELVAENRFLPAARTAVAETFGQIHRPQSRPYRAFGAALEASLPAAGALDRRGPATVPAPERPAVFQHHRPERRRLLTDELLKRRRVVLLSELRHRLHHPLDHLGEEDRQVRHESCRFHN
jgi:hypothetical protein